MSRMLLAITLFLSCAMAQAAYYECRDLKGNITLQQQPCQGVGVKQKQIALNEKPAKDDQAGSVLDAGEGAAAWSADLQQSLSKLGLSIRPEAYRNRFGMLREQHAWWLSASLALSVFGWWYGLTLLVTAFRQSFWWGIGYLFVPFVALIFIVVYWPRTWRYFLMNLVFLAAAFGLFMFAPLF